MSEHVTEEQAARVRERIESGGATHALELPCLVCGHEFYSQCRDHYGDEISEVVGWYEAELGELHTDQLDRYLSRVPAHTTGDGMPVCLVCGEDPRTFRCVHTPEMRSALLARLNATGFDGLRAVQLGENLRTSGETAPSTATPTKENTMTESTAVQSIAATIDEHTGGSAGERYPTVVASVTAALIEREYKISDAVIEAAGELGYAQQARDILAVAGLHLRPEPEPTPAEPAVELTHEQKLDAIMGFIADITPRLDGIDDSIAALRNAARANGIQL